MQIRMLPISFAFNRFPRIVHDLSRKLAKKVELKLVGEGTELDKTVLVGVERAPATTGHGALMVAWAVGAVPLEAARHRALCAEIFVSI